MKRRKLAWLLSGALLLVIILAIAYSRFSAEPTYNGKTLSQWLEVAEPGTTPDDFAKSREAQNAISAIGTNALPYLLKWIQYRPSRLRVAMFHASRRISFGRGQLRSSFQEHLTAGDRRAGYCVLALSLLGTNAYPAIPELCALAHDATDTSAVPRRALDVLGSMGSISTPCMLSIMTNFHFPSALRMSAAASIGQSENVEDRPADVVPEFLKMLDSGDRDLIMGAVIGLGNIAKVPELCVPALIRTLQNTNADPTLGVLSARALGSFGTNAIGAVPALLNQMKPGKASTLRESARSALHRINPKALENQDRASP